MKPIVDGLGEDFEGRVAVIQLDAEQKANALLQGQYEVRGHPSFALLDGEAEVIQRLFGPQSEETLHQAMLAIEGQ